MFKEKLALVPELPGSYQMKDKDNNIIYVGKAKNLKKRLKSYFTKNVVGKTKKLVSEIADFEYIVTSSELESLILEITLIKKYNPKYNILLKDDKSYPYIEFTKDKYPILKVVRNVKLKKNKNDLYGPYPNVGAARRTVEMLNRIYPLRKCENLKKDYCLYYHIGECLGYCKNEVDENKLESMKKEITAFLNGDSSLILNKLKQEMELASMKLNFEKALEYKQMIEDINITLKDQKIVLNKEINLDLFNYYVIDNYMSIQVFFIRSGTLFGRSKKIINITSEPEEALPEYIIRFYEKELIPREILVPEVIDPDILSKYLNTSVRIPKKGDMKKLMDLAGENAKVLLEEELKLINQDKKIREEALYELSGILNKKEIHRIEAFDNSHLFGTFYVGGMVVFDDFIPNRNEYRKYKIDALVKDDLKAMEEVIYRRYYKVLMENIKRPDLIVVDGGENQVIVAKEILDNLNLDIPIIGLKKDDKHRTKSIITKDLVEIELDLHGHLYLFLSRISEEVHRFAITYHRDLKNKGNLSSILEMIPGIGEKRRKELLKKFKSLKKIKEASVEELSQVLPKDVSIELKKYLENSEFKS
ncbi:MAG: excinuclease ABC subunit UvrC [Bacilli bacterium]|nr:excinuclease ABC subunit UvrC [Bacilli bacterium]